MSKIVVMFANGFEEVEAVSVVDILKRGGIDTEMVSIEETLEVEGAHSITIKADKKFDEVNFSDVDMIILPGGMPGTLNLENYEPLRKEIINFYKEGKKLAAICAAPRVFGELGILEGKRATCYPGAEPYLKGAILGSGVENAGQIITSQGVGTALEFALEIVTVMNSKEISEKVREAILLK